MDNAIFLTLLALSVVPTGMNFALWLGCRHEARKVLDARRITGAVEALEAAMEQHKLSLRRLWGTVSQDKGGDDSVYVDPPSKKKTGKDPDWRSDPDAFIRYHTQRINNDQRNKR